MNKKHGGCKTPEYLAWGAMRERCGNAEHPEYPRYGGRGIRVCEEWQHSFVAFRRYLGKRPRGFSLDRIDPDGHYEPGNVRWADAVTQSINRRLVQRYEHDGRTLTLRQWAEATGIPYETLRLRIRRRQWSVPVALTTPVASPR